MDNYTLSIPLLFGILFGYIHHFNNLYVSNTKMIIRQSDQIQFLLTRIIELENKIKKLKTDITINDFLDTVAEDIVQEDIIVEDEDDNIVEDEDDNIVEDEDDEDDGDDDDIVEDDNNIEDDNNEKEKKEEKEFELIETNSTFKISKNNGWLRYIFN
jgi:hypothetical protein